MAKARLGASFGWAAFAIIASSRGLLDLSHFARDKTTEVWSGMFLGEWLPAAEHPLALGLHFATDVLPIAGMLYLAAIEGRRAWRKRATRDGASTEKD